MVKQAMRLCRLLMYKAKVLEYSLSMLSFGGSAHRPWGSTRWYDIIDG